MRLLLVEDEVKVARALQQGLSAEGYEVTVAGTGEEAFFLLTTRPFDLLLLDWMLPGRSGMEILAELRKRDFQAPCWFSPPRIPLRTASRAWTPGRTITW